MSVKSLKTGTRSISMLAGNTPEHHVLIAETTVGAGGAASVTFSSIPQTYQHLQVRGILRPANATNPGYDTFFRINNDSGSNYSRHRLVGDGASATSGGAASQTYGGLPYHNGSNSLTNAFSALIADFLDYANTSKNTTVRAIGGYDNNGSGYAMMTSSAWLSTAAVTSITIYTGNLSNAAEFTSFSLYGVR